MRDICLAAALAALILAPCAASGFEIEDRKEYTQQDATRTMRILSTADIAAFDPILRAFQKSQPGLNIDYVVAGSTEVMKAIYDEAQPFDLVISAAMDLQTKLANDGFALDYSSVATTALPVWASWHNQVFGFTQEPAAVVIWEPAFTNLTIPTNREELIELLRDNEGFFRGRIGTYDVRVSGAGYLFATQDSRNTESYWRLTEVMGRLDPKLYCCSGNMIDDVANGTLVLAYNVLGSYAETRAKDDPRIKIVPMQDFMTVMLRTALIPTTAVNTQDAGAMIDFLANLKSRADLTVASGLPPIDAHVVEVEKVLRPIRLGPGLLVFLDRLKRENFLRSWEASISQE